MKELFADNLPPADTDALIEGATNKYYTEARVNANSKVVGNTNLANNAQTAADAADVKATTNATNLAAATAAAAALAARVTALEGAEVLDQTYHNAETQPKGAAPVDTSANATPSEGDRHAELYSNFYTRWAYESGAWVEKISVPTDTGAGWIRTAVDVAAGLGDQILCITAALVTVTMPSGSDGDVVVVARKGANDVNVAPDGSDTVESQSDFAVINLDGRRADFRFDGGASNWEAIGITNP